MLTCKFPNVDPTGDGSGDQSGAAFLQQLDPAYRSRHSPSAVRLIGYVSPDAAAFRLGGRHLENACYFAAHHRATQRRWLCTSGISESSCVTSLCIAQIGFGHFAVLTVPHFPVRINVTGGRFRIDRPVMATESAKQL